MADLTGVYVTGDGRPWDGDQNGDFVISTLWRVTAGTTPGGTMQSIPIPSAVPTSNFVTCGAVVSSGGGAILVGTDYGSIYRSTVVPPTSSGDWSLVYSSSGAYISDMRSSANSIVALVDDAVVRSTDGGLNWASIGTFSGSDYPFYLNYANGKYTFTTFGTMGDTKVSTDDGATFTDIAGLSGRTGTPRNIGRSNAVSGFPYYVINDAAYVHVSTNDDQSFTSYTIDAARPRSNGIPSIAGGSNGILCAGYMSYTTSNPNDGILKIYRWNGSGFTESTFTDPNQAADEYQNNLGLETNGFLFPASYEPSTNLMVMPGLLDFVAFSTDNGLTWSHAFSDPAQEKLIGHGNTFAWDGGTAGGADLWRLDKPGSYEFREVNKADGTQTVGPTLSGHTVSGSLGPTDANTNNEVWTLQSGNPDLAVGYAFDTGVHVGDTPSVNAFGPQGFAFHPSTGNYWVANGDNNVVTEHAVATGTVLTTIDYDAVFRNAGYSGIGDIDFDSAGNLWAILYSPLAETDGTDHIGRLKADPGDPVVLESFQVSRTEQVFEWQPVYLTIDPTDSNAMWTWTYEVAYSGAAYYQKYVSGVLTTEVADPVFASSFDFPYGLFLEPGVVVAGTIAELRIQQHDFRGGRIGGRQSRSQQANAARIKGQGNTYY